MSLSAELIAHAIRLLGDPSSSLSAEATDADLRRAVSASYYALFHLLNESVVQQIAPSVREPTAHRIHRWLDHTEMKKICREFSAVPLQSPLRELLGMSASKDLQTVVYTLIELQEARHQADYDPGYVLDWDSALGLVTRGVIAMEAWNRVHPSEESNIFVLSLLLRKKWDVVRS